MHQNSRGGIVYTAMMFMDIAASEILISHAYMQRRER